MLGFIALGFLISQFFIYDIKDLGNTRSILKLLSVFIISVSSITSGLLIKVKEE